jgi:hypothetical protein
MRPMSHSVLPSAAHWRTSCSHFDIVMGITAPLVQRDFNVAKIGSVAV